MENIEIKDTKKEIVKSKAYSPKIQVLKQSTSIKDFIELNKKWGTNKHEITIEQKSEEVKIDEKTGVKTITPKVKKINLTRQINATAKVLKNDTAIQKLEELKEIFSKEGK